MEEGAGRENLKEPRDLAALREERLWLGSRMLIQLETVGESLIKEGDTETATDI